MFYDYVLTVPKNTLESSPAEQEISLTHGVITHVEVEFLPGPAWLVQVYVKKGLHQVWPTNPDGKLKGDGRAIVWNEYEELFEEPYTLTLGGFSPGTHYDHEIIFRFEVMPREVAERRRIAETKLAKMREFFGIK